LAVVTTMSKWHGKVYRDFGWNPVCVRNAPHLMCHIYSMQAVVAIDTCHRYPFKQ
jgi:hypothetical protein